MSISHQVVWLTKGCEVAMAGGMTAQLGNLPSMLSPPDRLTVLSRALMVCLRLKERVPLCLLAAQACIILRMAYTWLDRYLAGGGLSPHQRLNQLITTE